MEEQKVQTCDFYRTDPNLPHRFNNPDCFQGYSQKIGHPLYRTSNQTYGSKKPTVHEIQTQFKGSSCRFSEAMLQSGMYRDHGFNTSVERSRVMVSTATQTNRVNLHNYYYGNKSKDINN
ncbi:piercer of microtubule wall 1 protein [Anoplopoma fimbria]|uniref:piercer of microtubule wall 1 protein n=1 Tax=Anoplopoma fimbria TaxID=229290 RepID=UPI0023ECA5AA|nr:piercer of microtubule wall 1 protein [Anoplopoma fimbria]